MRDQLALRNPSHPRRGFFLLALGIMAASVTAGCGGGKGKVDGVSGKVTMNGSPVAGEVTFLCSDGKEIKTLIALDGSYTVPNPPKGEAKIGVKSMMAAPAGAKTPENKGGAEMPSAGAGGGGAAPPAKYSTPATSGLTYTVKGGEEKFDITLTP